MYVLQAYMGPSLKQKSMIYNLHGTVAKKGIAIYSLQSKREAHQSKGRSMFTKVGIVGLFRQIVGITLHF
jgi:hypothetical protein